MLIRRQNITDTVPYLTGGVNTKGKFAYQYGKVEIKAKLENAKGAWPAMWMLSRSSLNMVNIPEMVKLI